LSKHGALVLERNGFDFFRGRLLTWRTIISGGKAPQVHATSVRLFAAEELVGIFEMAGLEEISLFSGFSEQDPGPPFPLRPYTPDSARICVIGRKPK
jgi:hypothetical protein